MCVCVLGVVRCVSMGGRGLCVVVVGSISCVLFVVHISGNK